MADLADLVGVNAGQVSPESVDSCSVSVQSSARSLEWTKEEDLLLISSWLHYCHKGHHQSRDGYWEAVQRRFYRAHDVPQSSKRTVQQLKDRWSEIDDEVMNFTGHFTQCKRIFLGESDDELYDRAVQMYEALETPKHFVWKHCWEALRREPRWDDPFTFIPRPPGIKAAKRKSKESNGARKRNSKQ